MKKINFSSRRKINGFILREYKYYSSRMYIILQVITICGILDFFIAMYFKKTVNASHQFSTSSINLGGWGQSTTFNNQRHCQKTLEEKYLT